MRDAAIVFSTSANMAEARKIARSVVESRLAACVQLVPGITSVYRWEGSMQEGEEVLLLFKTTEERLPELKKRITELHSYDTPEFVAVPVCSALDKYLAWLQDQTAEP
jgi:periplasmic divalent cation tolerance protein